MCLVLSILGHGEIAADETEEASGEVEQVSAMQSPIHAPAQPKPQSSSKCPFDCDELDDGDTEEAMIPTCPTILTLCLVLSQLGRGEIAADETKEVSGELGQVSAMQLPIHVPAQPKSKSKSSKRPID